MSHATQQLRKLIHDAGLARIEDRIMAVAQPSSVFRPSDSISKGLSKFGGFPNLPEGELWPTLEGEPLDFVCQLELPAGITGDQSLLFMLFYDMANRPNWGASDSSAFAIRCYNIKTQLVEMSHTRQQNLREQRLESFLSYVLPRHRAWTPEGPEYKSLGLLESDRDRYEEMLTSLSEYEDGISRVCARIFHHAEHWFESSLYISGEALERPLAQNSKQFFELAEKHAEWLPLLVIPSFSDRGLVFGDMENLVVWVNREALKNRDITKTYISIEG